MEKFIDYLSGIQSEWICLVLSLAFVKTKGAVSVLRHLFFNNRISAAIDSTVSGHLKEIGLYVIRTSCVKSKFGHHTDSYFPKRLASADGSGVLQIHVPRSCSNINHA